MKLFLTVFMVFCLLMAPIGHAQRIKDLASIQGVRSNQLVGYGLVVGLPGTGEQSPFTEQSFRTMLSNFGISLDSTLKPKIKNVAAVAVHAELPPFLKPGQTIDVTVSSVGEAASLRGGTLLQTFLKGLDGKVYAVAQGSMVVSGFGAEGADGSKIVANTPTVGRIANGAIIERAVQSGFMQNDFLTINLNYPDFSTAKILADTINQRLGADPEKGYVIATPIDAASVRVSAPRDVGQRVGFLATVENFEFVPAKAPARIVINSRTGTIVIGQDVRLLPAAITHGGLTVTISENQQVTQPNPLAQGDTVVTDQSIIDVNLDDTRMFKFDPGVTLDQLVRAVNEVGAAPGDLMAILEALSEAGALQGELVVI
ncbi:flagellar basal body P-ring protein FlgI [Paraglaciecola polaris]|uniref:Flagellar P-ring protein n=1 Tax=Paraglaciecola polaris LMG 21857 TaxID=1129793 RepID=K6YNX2_9ALTE|nr:flagellar basal body P-ring protein FlgI [Paraglaciecola polaris]GAC34409.1 flagellar P-ring protein precursor FlgI [Paraglaciecola polaris LMG 21857]|tara:strand:- start:880 stop:1992 length:1113 start_codon:yes stop_codon:yes gene_type:complete